MNKHEIEKAIKILKVHSSHITDIKGVFNFEGGLTAKSCFNK